MCSRFSYAHGDLQIYEPKNQYDMALAIDILETSQMMWQF